MNAARRVTRVSLAFAGVLVGVLVLACSPALAVPPESPSTVVVESINATGATVHGVLNPGKTGEPGTFETGTYEFLYKQSKTECEGGSATTPGMSLGGGKEEVPAETLSGLKQDSEYTICLRVKTAGGTVAGPKVTFTTAIPPETPETETPNPISATTATLNGMLNPKNKGEAGSYEFLYRVSSSECQGENATPTTSAHGNKEEAVSVPVTGLQPGAQYTVCLLARNAAQETALGAPVTFSTPASPPAVDGESVAEGTPTSYTLQAQINPNNQRTTYYFEYSTKATGETLEGTVTKIDGGTLPGEFGDRGVSAPTGSVLTPGLTYYYRVVASNGTQPPTSGKVQSFATPEVPVTESAVEHGATAVVLKGELSPHGASGKVTYHFAYNDNGSCEGALSTPPVEVAEGKQLDIQVEVLELEPNTEYKFCLVSKNAYGGEATGNEVSAHTTRHAPKIADTSVTDVTFGAATVTADVYAYGVPTTYHVEYGTTARYGSNTPEVSIGAGPEAVGVQALLSDLTPRTEYHYRIVATSEVGSESTPDATFTTGAAPVVTSPSVSERVDEMVTPVENENAEVHRQEFYGTADYEDGINSDFGVFQAAADGEAVAYMTSPTAGGFGEEEGGIGGDQQVASRRPGGGWTQVLAEPHGKPFGYYGEIQAFSPNFSFGYYETECTVCGLPDSLPNRDGQLYESPGATSQYTPASQYTPLITTTPPNRGTEASPFGAWEVAYTQRDHFSSSGVAPVFAGASADGNISLFEANDKLTENAPGGAGEDPQTHLQYAHENNLYLSSGGRLSLVNVLPDGSPEANGTYGAPSLEGDTPRENPPDFSNVISSDGSRIFWTDLNTGDLYVRENATQPQSPLEGSRCTDPSDACTLLIAEDARFWTATPEGSKVFYTKGGLYEYDFESARATELSEGAHVEGVLGTSEDGSSVYYAAEGAKLYVYREEHKPQLIAQLSPEDGTRAEPYRRHIRQGAVFGDWVPGLGHRTAEVTPSGGAVVFISEESLTGYNNEKLPEVYVYEAEDSQLFCASCSPSGEPPLDVNSDEWGPPASAALPVSFKDTFQPTFISEDGSEVFFESSEPLVSQATDGRINVYEWQRDGTHGCERQSGCISLLSGGESPTASWLIGASSNGSNVFMITRAQLAPEDQNEYYNVYDARVGGQRPVSPVCTGTGCQGLPAPPPTFATPASVTFEGVGNFPPSSGTVVASHPKSKSKAKSLSRTQKLAKALKACARPRRGKKRKSCEQLARRRYGARSRAKKPAKVKGRK